MLLTACDDMHAHLYDVEHASLIEAFSGVLILCNSLIPPAMPQKAALQMLMLGCSIQHSSCCCKEIGRTCTKILTQTMQQQEMTAQVMSHGCLAWHATQAAAASQQVPATPR